MDIEVVYECSDCDKAYDDKLSAAMCCQSPSKAWYECPHCGTHCPTEHSAQLHCSREKKFYICPNEDCGTHYFIKRQAIDCCKDES